MTSQSVADFLLDGELPVTFRHLRRDDLRALEWEGAYRHFRRVYAYAFERARKGKAVLWVAQAEAGKLLAQLFVLLNSEFNPEMADGKHNAFIHSFRVRPEHRSQGLGSRLLAVAESDLLRRGYERVFLNVARENHRAVDLYERLGYDKVAKDPGKWTYVDHLGRQRNVHEPSWRMRKKLLSSV